MQDSENADVNNFGFHNPLTGRETQSITEILQANKILRGFEKALPAFIDFLSRIHTPDELMLERYKVALVHERENQFTSDTPATQRYLAQFDAIHREVLTGGTILEIFKRIGGMPYYDRTFREYHLRKRLTAKEKDSIHHWIHVKLVEADADIARRTTPKTFFDLTKQLREYLDIHRDEILSAVADIDITARTKWSRLNDFFSNILDINSRLKTKVVLSYPQLADAIYYSFENEFKSKRIDPVDIETQLTNVKKALAKPTRK